MHFFGILAGSANYLLGNPEFVKVVKKSDPMFGSYPIIKE